MEKPENKIDRRVLKTKRAIHQAFVQLMTEKPIDDISVTEIANLADINRKTFYNYYSGVYQLVDEIENEMVDCFAELIETIDFENVIANPSDVFDKFFKVVSENVSIIDSLFSPGSNSALAYKILEKMIEITRDAALKHFTMEPERIECIVRFIFAGEIAVYQDWFHSDRSMSICDLAYTVETLCTKGIDGFPKE